MQSEPQADGISKLGRVSWYLFCIGLALALLPLDFLGNGKLYLALALSLVGLVGWMLFLTKRSTSERLTTPSQVRTSRNTGMSVVLVAVPALFVAVVWFVVVFSLRPFPHALVLGATGDDFLTFGPLLGLFAAFIGGAAVAMQQSSHKERQGPH
jgi:uncharacterized membrane protein YhdT